MRFWGFIALVWFCLHVVLTMLSPHPITTNPYIQLEPASSVYIFGTDYLGRDVLTRSAHGGLFTMQMSVLITTLTLFFAYVIAIVAEIVQHFGELVTILTNIFLALPSLILILLLMAILPSDWVVVLYAIGLAQIPPSVVLLRPSIRQSLQSDYSLASYAMGATMIHRLYWHISRDLSPIAISYVPILVTQSIFYLAAVAFLGLSPDISQPDWGIMLAEGRGTFRDAPLTALVPGISITFTIFVLNRLGAILQR